MIGAIHRDIDVRDVAIGGKQIDQIGFRDSSGQVIYIDFCVDNGSFSSGRFE